MTPYGTRLATYPLEFALLQSDVVHYVGEWQPLDIPTALGAALPGFLLAFLVLQALLRRPHRLQDVLLVVVAAFQAFAHTRFLLFFALVFAPMLATLLARLLPPYQPEKDQPILNAALICLLAGGVVAWFPSQTMLQDLLARIYPREAAEYLRRNPVKGRMYNDDEWGNYLIWSLGPEHQVFFDGRYDLYVYAGVFVDFARIKKLDTGTPLLLQKYPIDSFLIDRRSPLKNFLESKPEWERVYQDRISMIFVRKKRSGG